MNNTPDKKQRPVTVSELFPDLAPQQLNEIRDALDDYCRLLFQIFERLERERRGTFDDDRPGP
jgi:hypothetical protein